MSLPGPERRLSVGQSTAALPANSDVDFLRDLDCIIDLDAEVTNRAFNLCVPKQQLDSTQIACPPVD